MSIKDRNEAEDDGGTTNRLQFLDEHSISTVQPIIIKKGPDGILRSLGRFKNDPMLDELIRTMDELREADRTEEKAA